MLIIKQRSQHPLTINLEFKFYQPNEYGYIFVETFWLNGYGINELLTGKKVPNMCGQICKGGYINSGSTLDCDPNNEEEFKRVCRRWYRQYQNNRYKNID